MRVEDVVDRESFGEYLTGILENDRAALSRSIAVRLALRSIIAPVRLYSGEGSAPFSEDTLMCVFGHALVCDVAAKEGTRLVRIPPKLTAPFEQRPDYESAANGIKTLQYAWGQINSALGDSRGVSRALDMTIAAFDSQEFIWDALQEDLKRWEDDGVIMSAPLWPDGDSQIKVMEAFLVARNGLENNFNQHGVNWSFWVAWYQRILVGRTTMPSELGAILINIPAEDWEKGPAHINPMFDEVLALYLAEDEASSGGDISGDVDRLIDVTPQGEDVVFDQNARKFSLSPTDQINQDFLPDILDQIKEAEEIFDDVHNMSNEYVGLVPEIDKLTKARERYSGRPVMLFKRVHSIELRIDSKISNGLCPTGDQDENIAELKATLGQVQAELIAFSPEIRAYSEQQNPQLSEEISPQIAEGAVAVAVDADTAMADAIAEDVSVLESEETTEEEKRVSANRLLGIVVRSYKAARPHIKETAAVIKEVTIIAGAVGAGGSGLAWLISPAFRELVRNVIKAWGL